VEHKYINQIKIFRKLMATYSEQIKQKLAEGLDSVKSGASAVTKAAAGKRQQSISTSRRTFDTNKYKIDQLTYPMDLMSPQYGGNYAIFYVNISDASRLSVTEQTVELNPETEFRLRSKIVGNAEKLAQSIENTIKSQIPEAAATVDMKAIKEAVPLNSRSQRRLKTAIALHIPNQLSVRYGMIWGEEDTALAQAAMQAGSAVAEALSGNPAALKKALTDTTALAAEGAIAVGLSKLPQKGAISAASGVAANPKKEQTFQGVDFRKFTFDYQFYPRDEFEAENVLKIIHQFKLHMHPEFKSELNYVWIYPSEFDIIYYTNGGENLNIHRHTSCVLEGMNVNYTPNGNFSVFANGMPTQINVSLEFRELQLASKETIGETPGGL
jgi:hypothetical protein